MSTEPMNDDLAKRLADGLVSSADNIRSVICDMMSRTLDDDLIDHYVDELEWMLKNDGQQIHSMIADHDRMNSALRALADRNPYAYDSSGNHWCAHCGSSSRVQLHDPTCPWRRARKLAGT